MTARPMLLRETRERCARRNHGTIFAPRNAATYCGECGAIFLPLGEEQEPEAIALGDDGETVGSTLDIDWPATEAADRGQMELEGQGRLPL